MRRLLSVVASAALLLLVLVILVLHLYTVVAHPCVSWQSAARGNWVKAVCVERKP
jgi:methionine-rich copper-binding protein CopC